MWYTSVAEVTVLPVPGGPWMRERGEVSTDWQAMICDGFSSGRPGADSTLGTAALMACGATSCPSNLHQRRVSNNITLLLHIQY